MFEAIANPAYTQEQHDVDFKFSITGYEYPASELKVHWKVIEYSRARMQEHWDLYQGQHNV